MHATFKVGDQLEAIHVLPLDDRLMMRSAETRLSTERAGEDLNLRMVAGCSFRLIVLPVVFMRLECEPDE